MPIVEPEILLDGDHDIDRTLEVAEMTWAETFKYLADNNVLFEGILLKPSMVTPGAEHAKKNTPEEVRCGWGPGLRGSGKGATSLGLNAHALISSYRRSFASRH